MKDTLHLADPKPRMVAHRGTSGRRLKTPIPPSLPRAIVLFRLETDVHRTADGQFILFHDDNTKRVCPG